MPESIEMKAKEQEELRATLGAFNQIVKFLIPLDQSERARILVYMKDRFIDHPMPSDFRRK